MFIPGIIYTINFKVTNVMQKFGAGIRRGLYGLENRSSLHSNCFRVFTAKANNETLVNY
jgi:hypothetical protein